jgi:hypothetical protein
VSLTASEKDIVLYGALAANLGHRGGQVRRGGHRRFVIRTAA